MNEKKISEVLLPQKFSTCGVRLDKVAGHPVLVNFFQDAGWGLKNFIYATDVVKIKAAYANKDGVITVNEARSMGLGGNDVEIMAAVQYLFDVVVLNDLPEQETYPLKMENNESLNYNKNGELISHTTIEQDGTFTELVYDNGNTDRVIKKYFGKPDGTMHFIEYNPLDLSKIQSEAIVSPAGTKIKRVYSYDNRNNLKSFFETGNNYNKSTLLDDCGRTVYVRETFGDIIKKITNIYDDKRNIMLQAIENDPQLLRAGIATKKSIYATEKGLKTDKLLSEVNVLPNGMSVKVK